MTQTRFSIAHLSDPHLSRPEPVAAGQLLNKRILGYLSWRRRRRHVHRPEVLELLLEDLRRNGPDHTVVTGDLTHIGLPVEFEQVADWLARLGTPADVTVIPGNHDTYVREAWASSFASWQDYLRSDDAADWSADSYPSLRVRGPVALIGISTAVPTPWFRASGRVGRAQRERLAALLEQLRGGDLFRLALVHHAPVPGIDPWRKRMTDVHATRQVLAEGEPHLVLHGHDHRVSWSAIASARGDVPVVAVPSASYAAAGAERSARYNIYHLERGAAGWQVEVEVRGVRDGAVVELERRPLRISSQAAGSSA